MAKEAHDDLATVFNQLRKLLAARLVARNKPVDSIDLEFQIAEISRGLPLSTERRLTVTDADKLAKELTDGAMCVMDLNGRMELRRAGADTGVRLFPYLTTRAGIAAAVIEYYR